MNNLDLKLQKMNTAIEKWIKTNGNLAIYLDDVFVGAIFTSTFEGFEHFSNSIVLHKYERT